MSPSLRILAFNPFDAGSHAAVRQSIDRHSRHAWRWITRPGRAWKWRMRLAAIEMLDIAERQGLLARRPDVIFATSLMSAADLRALLPATWRDVPLVLYMHENQAAYPAGHVIPGAGDRDLHFALTNLASVLAADAVVWNSAYNRDSFIEAMGPLLRKSPDGEIGDWATRVATRSEVIWPPVESAPPGLSGVLHNAGTAGSTRVVWPHRWEHDKGPETLLELAEKHSEALDLRWVILGQQFREIPGPLRDLERRLAGRIEHIGYVSRRDEYLAWLQRSDWVLSTARHEFFGIAVAEAMLAGCLPWLPDRLSYPEITPPVAHGLSPMNPPDVPDAVRRAVIEHLAPCVADESVRRIDDAVERLAAG